jgi:translocation and assembly module TamA
MSAPSPKYDHDETRRRRVKESRDDRRPTVGTSRAVRDRVVGRTILGVALLVAGGGCASRSKKSDPVVWKLDLQGNHALSDRKIEHKILTAQTGWWPFAEKLRFDPVVWSSDLKRIKRLYESWGFYQAAVRDTVTPDPPDGVALQVEIREGAPTRVSALDLAGLDELSKAERDDLLAGTALKVGAIFKESVWENAKTRLATVLRNRGYAQVAVQGQALIDVDTQQADLRILVRLGPRYRFGDIRIDTGVTTPTDAPEPAANGGGGHKRRHALSIQPAWIWEQVRLAIPERQLYSDRALEEAQRRVSNMGVFAAVKVTAGQPDPATGLLPVLVETREAPFHTLKLGVGVRVDQIRDEARLIGEWTNSNFLGGMRRLTLHGEAGWAFIPNAYAVFTNDQTVALRNGPVARARVEFEQPRFLERPSLRERSSFELDRTLEQTYDDLGGQLVNGVVWQPHSSLSIYPSHHLQGDYLNGPPGASVLTAPLTLGCKTSGTACFVWLSYLEETITWDRRDNALEPRNGFFASLALQQGGGPLQGNFTYLRVQPELRGFRSFGDDKELTFAGRFSAGDLFPSSGNPDDSAVVTRFYGGGAQSMRGFNDRRLSPLLLYQPTPTLANPNPPVVTLPIGGNGLIDGSVEVRYAVTSSLIVAGFVDFGQATRGRLQPEDFQHLLFAVGFGLRYLTPVGPVRVDFGRRLQVGRPPPLLTVDAAGRITEVPYQVNDSCFGLGGSGRTTVVSDNLCVLHISIGEAF